MQPIFFVLSHFIFFFVAFQSFALDLLCYRTELHTGFIFTKEYNNGSKAFFQLPNFLDPGHTMYLQDAQEKAWSMKAPPLSSWDLKDSLWDTPGDPETSCVNFLMDQNCFGGTEAYTTQTRWLWCFDCLVYFSLVCETISLPATNIFFS